MGFLHKNTVKASKIGSTLVAVYYGATPPLSWRYDLEKNPNFTLAIKNGDSNDWLLGVTTDAVPFTAVARFLAQDDAEHAFAKTNKALLKSKYANLWRAAAILFGAVFFFFVVLAYLGRDNARLLASGGTPVSPVTPLMGVPQSADDVLKAPD